VFDLYDSWTNLRHDRRDDERRAVARGQALFNTKRINISGVAGINDNPAFGRPANLVGTCTSCHNTPNSGNHSVSLQLNIGIADASRRTADMPLYTLRNKTTHEIKTTTDPGRSLITGLWGDIGKFKGPVLRAVATRAPYFHNGSAKNLAEVIDFYDTRFAIGLTHREKADLIAFLRTL
jgi:cytochrome c peroxidase